MKFMFGHAHSFNSDISRWDVSKVTEMSDMFLHAKSFNADITGWEVASATSMNHMFQDATSFEWQLCGPFWVHSAAEKKQMFARSQGSIPPQVCGEEERELIALNTPISASASTPAIASACTKCGTFKKSGRVSCCAPGGAWYNNCGGVGDRTVDHRWLEGVEVCTRKFGAHDM